MLVTRLGLLGAPSLRAPDGRELHSVLAQPKRLALLAYLGSASAAGFVRRDVLFGLFWPESDAQRARNALNQAVHQLRQSLGEGVLVGRGNEELGLDPSRLEFDAVEFQRALSGGDLTAALELYRGDLLPGFYLSGCPEWERWLDGERSRLRAMALEAARTLAERCEARGELPMAARWSRRALEVSPDDERAVRRLISLLDRMGDRAGAERAYEEFAQHLPGAPAAETRALIEAVRARAEPLRGEVLPAKTLDPDEAPPAPNTTEAEPPAPAPGSPPVRRSMAPEWSKRWSRAGVVLAIAALAALAAASFQSIGASTLARERVVVGVFENQTGDPQFEPVGRMAADWITQGLSETGVVEVVPSMTVLRSQRELESNPEVLGGTARTAALAEETNAAIVVWGAFYRSGDSIQFQAQVTDVAQEKLLHALTPVSGPADAPLEVISALRQRVMAALAASLDPRVADHSAAGSQPPTFAAYQEYVEGVEAFLRSEYPAAASHFESAAAMDSNFVIPALGAALTRANLGEWARADSIARELDRDRERMGPYDRSLLDGIRALVRGDRVGNHRAARISAKLAPGSLAAYQLAYSSLLVNRPAEAVAALAEADPSRGDLRGWHHYWGVLTMSYHLLGRHRDESDAARQAIRQYPEAMHPLLYEVRALAAQGRTREITQRVGESLSLPPQSRLTPRDLVRTAAKELHAHGHAEAARSLLRQAIALRQQGDAGRERYELGQLLYLAEEWDEAQAVFTDLARQDPDHLDYLGHLGTLAARRGDRREAQRISAALAAVDRPYLFGTQMFWRARIASLLGQREQAVLLLRDALAQGYPDGYPALHADIDLAPLRTYPPFVQLLRPRG